MDVVAEGSEQRRQRGSVDAVPATEIEELGDPKSPPISPRPPTIPPPPPRSADGVASLTRGQLHSLQVAGWLVAYGLIAQVLIVVWLGVGALIVASAGAALLNGGTFELADLRTCTVAALAINGVILAGFVMAWGQMRARRPPAHPSLYQRHPILTSGVVLLAALGALTGVSLGRDYRGVREVTTTVVLANAYFFALLAVAWSLRLAVVMWRAIKRWALGNAFRAGIVTMWFLVLALAGLVLRHERWYAAPLDWIRAEIDLAPVSAASSAMEAEHAVLCVGAQELSENLAAQSLPRECKPRFALAAVGAVGPLGRVLPRRRRAVLLPAPSRAANDQTPAGR